MARHKARALPFPVKEVLPEGQTWYDTHQHLHIGFVGVSDSNQTLVETVRKTIQPRTSSMMEGEMCGAWRSDISDVDNPIELLVVLDHSEACENEASYAKEIGVEVIRPSSPASPTSPVSPSAPSSAISVHEDI
jgi:hypothetical protein